MHFLMSLPLAKNKPDHLCQVKLCRNKKPKVGKKCSKCKMRAWREKNPIKAKFTHLRQSALRRKIEFTLTIEEFEAFCLETGYHNGAGRCSGDLHIDRRKSWLGYSIDNIHVLECSENSFKGAYIEKKLKHAEVELDEDPF